MPTVHSYERGQIRTKAVERGRNVLSDHATAVEGDVQQEHEPKGASISPAPRYSQHTKQQLPCPPQLRGS